MKQVDVSFIGDFELFNKRTMRVQDLIQMLADGDEEKGILPTPALADYHIQILNLKHPMISAGYGDDDKIVRIGIDFTIADPMEFYLHVSHILHVLIFDIDSGRFGEFADDRYAWIVKNSLNTYRYALSEVLAFPEEANND